MLKKKNLWWKLENIAFVALNLNLEEIRADKILLVEERHKCEFYPTKGILVISSFFSYE